MATTLARIEFRRKTAAQWTSSNEVLLASEPGVETDTGKWKFGDGTTTWSALPYQAPTAASLSATSATLWKANTAYVAGQAVVNPSGFVVTALANFTSSSSYSAANWSDPTANGYAALPSSRTTATALMQNEGPITPYQFGAKGDGKTIGPFQPASGTAFYSGGVSLTSGQNTVTASTSVFTSGDVGKLLVVIPAGGSTQVTWATTITGYTSGTVVTTAANAPYTGSSLEATWATDDTVALKAWMNATTNATRYLPGATFGVTDTLTYGGMYDVLCATGGTLKVMAQIATPTTWPASARAVPTVVASSFTVLNRPGTGWVGGCIDTSDLATDGFAPKWVRGFTVDRLTVRGGRDAGSSQARAFSFGDAQTTGTTYEVSVRTCRAWRDFGTVPRGGTALNSGGTPGSVGMYFDVNTSDCQITAKTVMMGYQVGYETHGSNVCHYGSHAWCRSTMGMMDYGFDDYVNGNQYVGTFADTPQYAGYRHRGTYGKFIGAQAYNNTAIGTDNQAVGFMLDNIVGNHQFLGTQVTGGDVTHRFKADFADSTTAFSNPSHPIVGHKTQNVVSARGDTYPNLVFDGENSSFSIFGADHGRVVTCANAGGMTITLGTGYAVGFYTDVIQTGTGQVTFAAGSGASLQSYNGLVKTKGQHARVRVVSYGGGVWNLSGDLG